MKTDGRVRYSVPQVITERKDVTLYFRVSDIFRKAEIYVKNEKGEVIYSKRRPKLAPGEMESITLKSEQIKNAKELLLGLEVL